MGDCQLSVLSAFTSNQPQFQAADDLSFFFRPAMPGSARQECLVYAEHEILILLYIKLPFFTNWVRRAAAYMRSSGRSIPFMCVARYIWLYTKEPKRPPNSRRFSFTAASWSAIP